MSRPRLFLLPFLRIMGPSCPDVIIICGSCSSPHDITENYTGHDSFASIVPNRFLPSRLGTFPWNICTDHQMHLWNCHFLSLVLSLQLYFMLFCIFQIPTFSRTVVMSCCHLWLMVFLWMSSNVLSLTAHLGSCKLWFPSLSIHLIFGLLHYSFQRFWALLSFPASLGFPWYAQITTAWVSSLLLRERVQAWFDLRPTRLSGRSR